MPRKREYKSKRLITFSVSQNLYTRIAALSKETGYPVATVLRIVLYNFLEANSVDGIEEIAQEIVRSVLDNFNMNLKKDSMELDLAEPHK